MAVEYMAACDDAPFSDLREWQNQLPRVVGDDLARRPPLEVLHSLADHHRSVYRRVWQLANERLANRRGNGPLAPHVFAVLGSGARDEQSLFGDQDHALVYDDTGVVRAEADPYFERVAEVTAALLHELHYPLCSGNVMASNSRWRGAVSEWQDRISAYGEFPDWDNIRFLLIASDAQAVDGDPALVRALRSAAHEAVRRSPFMRWRIAQQGLLHGVSLSRMGGIKGTINIKEGLYTPLVNSVRLWAIAEGEVEPSTFSRLAHLERAGIWTPALIADARAALTVALELRLRHHVRLAAANLPLNDHIELVRMPQEARDSLRAALRIARAVQQLTARRYPKPG